MVLRITRLASATWLCVALVVVTGPRAEAGCGDSSDVKAETNGYYAQSESAPCGPSADTGTSSASANDDYYTGYRAELVCFVRADSGIQSLACPRSAADRCQPGEALYQVFGLHDGSWDNLGQVCQGAGEAAPETPTVTPALVARAFQRIPLPKLRAITQPADKTLINFDTIFYVDAQPLHRSLRLLGQRVELEITPSTFRWVHGDGTAAVTQTPGAAYPAKDVVYRYQQAHVTVSHHVEITWTARWSLNGGPYQDVDGTVTTVGPDTSLRVAEATPTLSGFDH